MILIKIIVIICQNEAFKVNFSEHFVTRSIEVIKGHSITFLLTIFFSKTHLDAAKPFEVLL